MKPFLNRTTAYESTLVLLQDIIDNWLKVQAAWLYLEPIFSSDDIMKQIPTEGRLFKTVDATWIDSMAQTAQEPALLSCLLYTSDAADDQRCGFVGGGGGS